MNVYRITEFLPSGAIGEKASAVAENVPEALAIFYNDLPDSTEDVRVVQLGRALLSSNLTDRREMHLEDALGLEVEK